MVIHVSYLFICRPFQPRVTKQNNTEIPKKEVDDFDNDNWDLPEGDLPY